MANNIKALKIIYLMLVGKLKAFRLRRKDFCENYVKHLSCVNLFDSYVIVLKHRLHRFASYNVSHQ